MIRTITIQGYKSYPRDRAITVQLDCSQSAPVYFFGLNGAGKSAIAELLERHSRSADQFPGCRVETTANGPFRFMVYNESFVRRVLGQSGGMPGIFTLGEPNAEALARIEVLEEEKLEVEAELARCSGRARDAQGACTAEVERITAEVWKVHTRFSGAPLAPLLRHGNSRSNFFAALSSIPRPESITAVEDLERRFADATSSEPARVSVAAPSMSFDDLEAEGDWAECIHASAESRLSAFVAERGNGDWVGRGRAYVSDDQCPFCQQQLPAGFVDDLAALLDGTRQRRINLLERSASTYRQRREALATYITDAATRLLPEHQQGFAAAATAWIERVDANLRRIEAKLASPSQSVELAATGELRAEVVRIIGQADVDTRDFNQRVADRATERRTLDRLFWEFMRDDRSSALDSHAALIATLNEKHLAARDAERECAGMLARIETELSTLRQRQSGADAAVERINTRLATLGIRAFSIVRCSDTPALYALERPGQGAAEARTLSEGERTLIAFLYYLELLHGSHDATEDVSLRQTIAIVDDPISSLSQNHIYDVASLIHYELAEPARASRGVRQVVVLTHNLFFFHELLRLTHQDPEKAAKRCQLRRVVKNVTSDVVRLNPLHLLNDYDALWHTLRQARDGHVPAVIVPNTMRCILEHFFSFTSSAREFEQALESLSQQDPAFTSLARYLNRGSHKDRQNVSVLDCMQYDVAYYLEKLRGVFDRANALAHYEDRMHLDDGEQPLGDPARVSEALPV